MYIYIYIYIYTHIYIYIYTVLDVRPEPFEKLAILLNGCSTCASCQVNKQISQGFRACLWGKKIKKQFLEIRPGRPPTFNKTMKSGTFCWNGRRARMRYRMHKQISRGFRACLGVKKNIKEFWETFWPGRPPTTKPKNGHKKKLTLRPHR